MAELRIRSPYVDINTFRMGLGLRYSCSSAKRSRASGLRLPDGNSVWRVSSSSAAGSSCPLQFRWLLRHWVNVTFLLYLVSHTLSVNGGDFLSTRERWLKPSPLE
ncbi:hypothetical protein BU15DRAFT_65329 [Melanogaster broomeanus]|nr:hypothetical protein BU15DRAFT_65329 [Melanogaster broomeanus]